MVTSSQDTQNKIQNPNSGATSPTNPRNDQLTFEWKEKGGQQYSFALKMNILLCSKAEDFAGWIGKR